MTTHSVTQALETALQASPNDEGLLLHLAQLYKSTDNASRGLEVCQRLLSLDPTQLEAISLAIHYAKQTDNGALAERYEKLLSSLGGSTESPAPHNVTDSAHVTNIQSARDKTPERVRGTNLRLVKDDGHLDSVEIEDTHIYLKDVGGMEAVKKRLQLSFLAPLKNPEMMKAYGKSVRGGLLLYGPPGCGKTYIARALAGELGAKFITIGLSDILDMYIGESERKLHEIFETARRHSPAVLFIDEIDAIGQKRSQLKSSGLRTLVNQLLTEMDSLSSNNDNLFVLAATNHPWDVDSALKRPGRFDRMVAVFPPDAPARSTIFEYYLKDKPLQNDIQLNKLVQGSHLFSGADIAHVCNSAVEFALEDSLESGDVRPVAMSDLTQALKEHRPSTIPWFDSARNYAMFANEGGAFDDLLTFIKDNKL